MLDIKPRAVCLLGKYSTAENRAPGCFLTDVQSQMKSWISNGAQHLEKCSLLAVTKPGGGIRKVLASSASFYPLHTVLIHPELLERTELTNGSGKGDLATG